MEIEEELVLDRDPQEDNKRPMFLTVLCILTFIGAGFGVLGGIIGLAMMSTTEKIFNASNDILSNTDMGMDLEQMYRWTKISQLLNIVGSLLCLAGALFMWKLKRIGFYIYIPGQVLPLIGSFMTMNSMLGGGPFAGLGMGMTFFAMIFPIAFVIMYGLNLKHMR